MLKKNKAVPTETRAVAKPNLSDMMPLSSSVR